MNEEDISHAHSLQCSDIEDVITSLVLQSHCCTLHHRSLKNIGHESKPSFHETIAIKPSDRATIIYLVDTITSV
jgi:hypothetical protein